jgi:hypothetical protein
LRLASKSRLQAVAEQAGELRRLKIKFRTFKEERRLERRFAAMTQHPARTLLHHIAAVELGILFRLHGV